MAKNLLVFFSHSGENYFAGSYRVIEKGNTEVVADQIQKLAKCDRFKIETKKNYPSSYKECCDVALAEQRAGELPELKEYPSSIEGYDNIILCYPCWWGTMPRAVFTFLSHYDFSGKTIYPLCTHEGSGMGRSEQDIKSICPNSKIEKGLAVQGSYVGEAERSLKSWLKNLI